MLRRKMLLGLLVCGVFTASAEFTPTPSVEAQAELELIARARVFPEVGTGVTALKSRSFGAERRYFVLVPKLADGSSAGVAVYNAEGKRLGRIATPVAASGKAAASKAGHAQQPLLVYADDLDVDPAGRVYVADRGANAVIVFEADGKLAKTIPVAAPTSVVVLPEGEIAVASAKSAKLITIFDARGKVVREFGEATELAERHELNRFLNIGRLSTDAANNLYYSFSYLPEPTVRKYDRFGYAALEIELTTLEFHPAARATRREIERQGRGGTPTFKRVVSALSVDPETQDIWLALGNLLLHFDREGVRRGSYRTFTAEGARIEAAAILVEADRLLIASDPLGIFEFPRPDKARR